MRRSRTSRLGRFPSISGCAGGHRLISNDGSMSVTREDITIQKFAETERKSNSEIQLVNKSPIGFYGHTYSQNLTMAATQEPLCEDVIMEEHSKLTWPNVSFLSGYEEIVVHATTKGYKSNVSLLTMGLGLLTGAGCISTSVNFPVPTLIGTSSSQNSKTKHNMVKMTRPGIGIKPLRATHKDEIVPVIKERDNGLTKEHVTSFFAGGFVWENVRNRIPLKVIVLALASFALNSWIARINRRYNISREWISPYLNCASFILPLVVLSRIRSICALEMFCVLGTSTAGQLFGHFSGPSDPPPMIGGDSPIPHQITLDQETKILQARVKNTGLNILLSCLYSVAHGFDFLKGISSSTPSPPRTLPEEVKVFIRSGHNIFLLFLQVCYRMVEKFIQDADKEYLQHRDQDQDQK